MFVLAIGSAANPNFGGEGRLGISLPFACVLYLNTWMPTER